MRWNPMNEPEDLKKFDFPVKIGVVDDHNLFRSGIISLLKNFEKEVKVVLEACNGRDLFEQLGLLKRNNLPDIILLDLQMPEMNGIQTTLFLQEEYPAIKIIILTMHNEEEFIFDLMNKGASGFLAKDKTVETVMDAIAAIKAGGMYINEQILKAIVRGSERKTIPKGLAENVVDLSEKELELIQLICGQKTNKEIADFLQLSTRTVEKYRLTIITKTGVKNTAGLVLYAIKHNLIKAN